MIARVTAAAARAYVNHMLVFTIGATSGAVVSLLVTVPIIAVMLSRGCR